MLQYFLIKDTDFHPWASWDNVAGVMGDNAIQELVYSYKTRSWWFVTRFGNCRGIIVDFLTSELFVCTWNCGFKSWNARGIVQLLCFWPGWFLRVLLRQNPGEYCSLNSPSGSVPSLRSYVFSIVFNLMYDHFSIEYFYDAIVERPRVWGVIV